MNIKQELNKLNPSQETMYFNDIDLNPDKIKAILVNEVVPSDPCQDFYGGPEADYLSTTIPLFQSAGIDVNTIEDILKLGIYITNAVKTPKSDYTIERQTIAESLPYLEKELSLFPNVKVIMLMGDVAKKAVNMIAKKQTKGNIIPAVATYKLRNSEIYHQGIRYMPSYIMTGKNILIEKSKFQMASEDLAVMYKLI